MGGRGPGPSSGRLGVLFLATLALVTGGCAVQRDNPNVEGQDLQIAFLHTTDMHARLLPYRMQLTLTDKSLGLVQEFEPFGGIARVAHILNRERARADRSVYIDTGDPFQGAPIFNVFRGEAALRTMAELQPDAMVIGNHEFDEGLDNLIEQIKAWNSFPILAANYWFEPWNELGDYLLPYTIVNAGGLRVGVIGIGCFSSLSSVTDVGNSLGIIPLNIEQVLQQYIDILRPQVDLLVVASHAGLSKDEKIIRCTQGVDIVLGGHLHVVLDPPKVIPDAAGRDVLLAHSGAFAKYVGRLDVVVRDSGDPQWGWEVVQHRYELFPVDSTVPNDARMTELLEDYRLELAQHIDLSSVYAYTSRLLTKYGYGGGDSSLGNLVSETIRQHARVDIGFTNTLGIRANMYPGVITMDDLYNVFPFNNSITTMFMSGLDLQQLFDYVTERSAGRGCVSQLQVAGVEFTMNCNFAPPECRCDARAPVCPGAIDIAYEASRGYECYGRDSETDRRLTEACLGVCQCPPGAEWVSDCRCPPYAQDIVINPCSDPTVADPEACETRPLDLGAIYEIATNDYIAHGGSGFVILRNNNTQKDTGLPMRDAVLERLIRSPRCIEECRDEDGVLRFADCPTYANCVADVAAFLDESCARIADTTRGRTARPARCALDVQGCETDGDCYNVATECADDACASCRVDAECTGEADRCYDGYCRPSAFRCRDERCLRLCESDEDCPGAGLVSASQRLCIGGVCQPASDGLCAGDADCAAGRLACFGADAAYCAMDEDCEEGLVCRSRLCVPAAIDCDTHEDCFGAGLAPSARCLEGRCVPEASPCASDGDCGPEGACVEGLCTESCQVCRRDTGCPPGLVCAEGFCVRPVARCEQSRCRGLCEDDRDCMAGARCAEGLCLPLECVSDQDLETVCRMENLWQAQEQCQRLSCPATTTDGRIRRILPENLENLPDFGDLDDALDFDEDVLGGGEEG